MNDDDLSKPAGCSLSFILIFIGLVLGTALGLGIGLIIWGGS